MAKTYKVLETNVGLVRIEEGKPVGDNIVLAALLTDGKVKTGTYESKDGTINRVIQMNSSEGCFASFTIESFSNLDIKIVGGWACVVATVVERPTVKEVNKVKSVKGATLI